MSDESSGFPWNSTETLVDDIPMHDDLEKPKWILDDFGSPMITEDWGQNVLHDIFAPQTYLDATWDLGIAPMAVDAEWSGFNLPTFGSYGIPDDLMSMNKDIAMLSPPSSPVLASTFDIFSDIVINSPVFSSNIWSHTTGGSEANDFGVVIAEELDIYGSGISVCDLSISFVVLL